MASSIFQLPLECLAQARPLTGDGGAQLTAETLERLQLEGPAEEGQEPAAAGQQPKEGGASTCIACGLGVGGVPGFDTAEEQRAHFRTDWHRYNVKRRVAGLAPVSEEQFAALLERDEDQADVGSLSGSEASLEDSGDEGTGLPGGTAGPQLQFLLPDGQRCAVWRCLVSPEPGSRSEPPQPDAVCLQQLQQLRAQDSSRWAVVLLRGGHFAAAVFNVPPATQPARQPVATASGSARQQGGHEGKWEAVVHKSFHRYVVRAGQGGKQSSKDASGKYARSAGSRLRRHNEAALERDIRETLSSWHDVLAGCQLLFVHAPSSNSATLFGGEAPPLDKADTRVRRVPFTTRRPTYSETKRVVRMLTTLYRIQPEEPEAHPAAAPGQQLAEQQQEGQQGQLGEEHAGGGLQAHEGPATAAAAGAATAAQQQGSAAGAAAVAEGEGQLGGVSGGGKAAADKKREKRAAQKARQREARSAEAAASRAAAEAAASAAAEDEISRAAAAALVARQQAKPAAAAVPPKPGAPVAAAAGKASGALPPRLSAKPRANEDAAVRRARAAAAAEARMKALQAASQQQQLY